MMLEMICPHCGAQNRSGAERCTECDALLIESHGGTSSSEGTPAPEEISFHKQDEPDLTDLLHALKQDGEITSDGQVLDDSGEADQTDLNPTSVSQSEGDVPDWLQRIRERAREEADAAGEITQKLSAAQESIDKGNLESQEENFASWIRSLRGETDQEHPESPPESQDQTKEGGETQEGTPQWLSKIRKVKGTTRGDDRASASDLEGKQGDSLLQWLVALEEGKEDDQPDPEETGASGKNRAIESQQEGFEAGEATQKIPAIGDDSRSKGAPKLDVSREEQLQANLFSSTVVDERAQRPLRKPERKNTPWAIRVIAALILIGALSVILFGGLPGERFDNASTGQALILASIEDLPEGASLLVVADYQAGFAEEIHLIAKPVLREALSTVTEIGLISSRPSGVLLSRRLLADLPIESDLEINDFGYYPSPVFGAYAVGDFPAWDQPWAGLPEAQRENLPAAFDGVFILADSYDSARFWVEQLNVRLPYVPLYLLVTAQAGPMLAPYQESGQVVGLVAGIADVEVMAEYVFFGEAGPELHLRSAYQVGTLLTALMIVISAIIAIKPKKKETKDGGSHGME